jgi:hypothetical protein
MEVHFIGELVSGFDFPENSLFCKYEFEHGDGWNFIEGEQSGRTQTDSPSV